MRRSFVTCIALVVVALAGCSVPPDRTGGAAAEPVRTLVLEQPNRGGPADPLVQWADEVSRLSDGKLTIEFENGWRDDPHLERSLVQHVRTGKTQLTAVAARVFDQIGYDGFQPLIAPFLLDSYDVERAVFERGIADEMLPGVAKLGVEGVAVLPGVLARVATTNRKATGPDALEGLTTATFDSKVQTDSLAALGARPEVISYSGDVTRFNALVAQPGAVSGNSYQRHLRRLAGNLVLWPRPLVVVMNKDLAGELTEKEREVLSLASEHLHAEGVRVAQDDDRVAMQVLCSAGVAVDYSSDEDRARLRAKVRSVYEQISKSEEGKSWLARIEALRHELAAPPTAVECPHRPGPVATASAGIPEGTYARSFTRAELEQVPGYQSWYPVGRMTLTFRDGVMTKVGAEGDPQTHTYSLFEGRIKADSVGPVDFIATYRVDGDKLWMSDFVWPDCSDCVPDEAAYSTPTKPWVRVK